MNPWATANFHCQHDNANQEEVGWAGCCSGGPDGDGGPAAKVEDQHGHRDDFDHHDQFDNDHHSNDCDGRPPPKVDDHHADHVDHHYHDRFYDHD